MKIIERYKKIKNNFHHIEYIPTGELFAEQRDHWATPYRFNGKELDEETGYCTNCNNKTEQTVLLFYNGKCRWLKCLEQSSPDDIGAKIGLLHFSNRYYYYGARYYTPEYGVWLSVDPLSDKYPSTSSFAYCLNNPVKLIDPNGMEVEYSSIEDRIKVAYLRLTSSDFRHSFKTLKKSEETYVYSGGKYKKNEFITDGEKLFINFSTTAHETERTTWANNIKHESEHAMQFEHGEVGFELFDTGGPLGGDGTYYPNNEWKAVNFDLDDEINARNKGYDGFVWNSDKDKNIKNEWRFGDFSIEAKKQSLRNAGYKGEVPVNNPNLEKVKTPTQYLLPHRERTKRNVIK